METVMTDDQLRDLKVKGLAKKLFALQCELADFQSEYCAYDQRDEIRSVILAIDHLLMQFNE